MFIFDFVAETVLDQIIDWLYGKIVGFLNDFFAMMNNMGVELFDLPWVNAITTFFSWLGWALFVVGLVVGAFECAIEYQADVIVFEYLETQGKLSGKKKQKLHLWRKRDIQKLCEHQAHRNGIHVSRVSARNTSRLACDGSGAVVRNPENHSLCTFRTGKQYNCDLSAAYNIGARYFIRELLKPFSETERSLLEAKVPVVKRRTSCVYADLRKLYVEVNNLKAA